MTAMALPPAVAKIFHRTEAPKEKRAKIGAVRLSPLREPLVPPPVARDGETPASGLPVDGCDARRRSAGAGFRAHVASRSKGAPGAPDPVQLEPSLPSAAHGFIEHSSEDTPLPPVNCARPFPSHRKLPLSARSARGPEARFMGMASWPDPQPRSADLAKDLYSVPLMVPQVKSRRRGHSAENRHKVSLALQPNQAKVCAATTPNSLAGLEQLPPTEASTASVPLPQHPLQESAQVEAPQHPVPLAELPLVEPVPELSTLCNDVSVSLAQEHSAVVELPTLAKPTRGFQGAECSHCEWATRCQQAAHWQAVHETDKEAVKADLHSSLVGSLQDGRLDSAINKVSESTFRESLRSCLLNSVQSTELHDAIQEVLAGEVRGALLEGFSDGSLSKVLAEVRKALPEDPCEAPSISSGASSPRVCEMALDAACDAVDGALQQYLAEF